MIYDFGSGRMADMYSECQADDAALIIREMLVGCMHVARERGTCYRATLRKNQSVLVEVRTNPAGEPDIALEEGSLAASRAELMLFNRQPQDSRMAVLMPAQVVLAVFRQHLAEWQSRYRVDKQVIPPLFTSGASEMVTVLVPFPVLHRAVLEAMLPTPR